MSGYPALTIGVKSGVGAPLVRAFSGDCMCLVFLYRSRQRLLPSTVRSRQPLLPFSPRSRHVSHAVFSPFTATPTCRFLYFSRARPESPGLVQVGLFTLQFFLDSAQIRSQ